MTSTGMAKLDKKKENHHFRRVKFHMDMKKVILLTPP